MLTPRKLSCCKISLLKLLFLTTLSSNSGVTLSGNAHKPIEESVTNCIYSRCCRLPLKRQFARLKLETLTDKDPGLLNAESGEEDNLTEMQRERNDTANSMGNAKELLSTQGAESVLPASQPQPVAAQAVMEDEELKIEEYDSD
ncbi:cell cycle checkpoint protein RAD17-like [Xenopus laevis]|uniref:Cell cycle checkpoint protein RAD17-like n=1 Tax=Xenopus laevis TaxID=8355 RepID=A0A8J1M404_XENLA|nr:cell cycle checkpoint protein RAD17-like [Xenopus laevis]XP_041436427.1 cell cycle checkpoint protein RAD17-like [Xenopus laevis]XP_041436428.1 cell cycle checkpoint protein RAD17-like [Xenopus laevis]